jgi:3-oxoacyl-[acyl-carrier protein] reductase
MRLEGKVAIITGAASGLGKGTAVVFAKEGAKVVVADLNEEGAKEVARSICEQGGDAIGIKVDVTKAPEVDHLVKQTVQKYGKVDIMFANAGFPTPAIPIEEVTEEYYDKLMGINLKGYFLCAKAVIPHFKKQKGGVLLCTSSIAGVRPRPGFHVYSAAKGGAIVLTKALAMELAPFKARANVLCPVAADTPMRDKFLDPKGDLEEGRKKLMDTIPLGRWCAPEDVAYAAVYLCSDEANFITGIEMNVDGGRAI